MSAELLSTFQCVGSALLVGGVGMFLTAAVRWLFDWADRKSRTIEPMDRDKALDYVIKNLWEKDGDK